MDFGKLHDIRAVDFSLPPVPSPQDESSLRVLRAARAATPAAVLAGCPIWSERQWLGRIYPLGARPADFLSHYARQFGTLELNSTHYHIPKPEAVDEWRAQTPADFRFCPKWPQEISHHRQLQRCDALTQLFCESISRLGDRLGTTFLQLHPGFAPRELPVLAAFLRGLPAGFPICIEFRHPGWFAGHALIPQALDVLASAGAGTVVTDVAGRRDVAHVSVSAPRVLLRFVGNELHPTDFERLDGWIPRFRLWLEAGLRELYFCAHQPDNVLAPELTRHFAAQMKSQAGVTVKDWIPMDQGTQMSLL